MAPPLLLGLDVGSSRVKGLLVDESGVAIGSVATHSPFRAVPAGVEATVEAVRAAVRRVLEDLGDHRGRVAGVGVAGVAESGAPLAADGAALAPVIAWHDPRGVETVRRLDERFGDDLSRRIGQHLRPVSSAAKLGWLLDHGVTGVARWLGVPELVLWGLTGAEATEHSLAARTGWYDVTERRYLPEVTAALGVASDVVPAVASAGAVMGRVSAEGAAWSGLPRGVPVTLAGHDHLAGAEGAGAGDRDLVNSVGTAETLLTRTATLPDVDEARSRRVAVTLRPGGPGWVVLASAARSGLVLAAAADSLGRPLPELDDLAARSGRQVEVDHWLAALERDEPAPPTPGPPGDVWAAVLATLAGRTWEAAGRLTEVVGDRDRLVVFGGGSRSRPWLRAKARSGSLPVWRSTATEAVARGAALFAGVAAGWWRSPDEAPSAPLEPVGPSGARPPDD